MFVQSGRELYAEANKIHAEADKKLNAAYTELIKSIRADNDKDQAEFVVKSLRGPNGRGSSIGTPRSPLSARRGISAHLFARCRPGQRRAYRATD